jgi:glycosyltransferase involved in cell wall biosynthesis
VRILVLHSRYRSGSASGENRVVELEAALLRDAGHVVDVWAPEPRRDEVWRSLRVGLTTVWSARSAREVRRLVRERRVDVVHCHNLFPSFSPVVVRAASAGGAAVVMTLHNYRLMCLPATLLRDGEICEDCVGRVPWRGVVHRCYRDSHAASAALGTSLTVHRAAGSFDDVDLFLAVSEFVRRKHVAAGLDEQRILVKPNPSPPTAPRTGAGDYFLVLGRLSAEKGVETVLAAHRAEHGRLLVVGDGPRRIALQLAAAGDDAVEFVGGVANTDVAPLLAHARALLVPSRSYEGSPLVIAEAFAAGVPVIGSGIGGVAEAIRPGENGLLVRPGDIDGWRAAMTRLVDDDETVRLGKGALRTWRDLYAPERVLERIEDAYRVALDRRACV